jgi:hypothetical protein
MIDKGKRPGGNVPLVCQLGSWTTRGIADLVHVLAILRILPILASHDILPSNPLSTL